MFHFILILSCALLEVLSDTFAAKCKLDRACVTKQSTYIYKSLLEDNNNHLDPMYKELIEGDTGTIKYSLTETNVTGFKKCYVKDANLDLKNLVYEMELFCSGFHVEGKYDAHGFLMGNPAEGNGEFTIDTKAYELKIRKDVSLTTKGDKHYLQFHKFNIDATPIDDLVYDFKNSFNGQKELVPYITKCKWDDSQCLTASTNAVISKFANGIPEANVEKIDPLLLDKVDASTPNLKFLIDHAKINGLKNCVAEKVERNLEKSKLYVAVLCTVDFSSNYVMNGKLLTLTIDSKSKMEIDLRKILIIANVDLEEFEKNGEKHWHIKKWEYNFELKGQSDIRLGNFAAGNEVIDKSIKDLIENNGDLIIMELCPPILKAIISKVIINVDKFFKHAPLDNLVINK